MSSRKNHNHAYVWLLMKGDTYLPGIIASVQSVKRFEPKADLVVMVTDDVSQEAIDKILLIATHVAEVSYIKFENKFNIDPRAYKKYGSWIDVSYTKWNCLALDRYDKVFLLDADVIVVKPIDHIFEMKAPASIFYQIYPKNDWHTGEKDSNGYLVEGAEVPPKVIKRILQGEFYHLAAASSILLEPSLITFRTFLRSIKQLPNRKFVNGTGADEQAISYVLGVVMNQKWYNLTIKWNSVMWMDYHSDDPLIMHFMAKDKPWNLDPNAFDDLPIWYANFEEACTKYKIDLKLKYKLKESDT